MPPAGAGDLPHRWAVGGAPPVEGPEPQHQLLQRERLLRDAEAKYGSSEEAARWVDRSAHVTGDAIDIGPPQAARWLTEHGAHYGLCRTYDNEPWHFELREDASTDGCPATCADANQDPRMQR